MKGKRDTWSAMKSRRGARWGVAVLATVCGVALLSDFIASDKPILARIDGKLYVLPNLFTPVGLRPYTINTLIERMGKTDWLIAPLVSWGANEQDKGTAPLAPPSSRHWLGTDTARRDVLARMVHGSRVSLLVGLASVSIFITIGTLLGLLAGFFGGWVDVIVSRTVETVMTIPVFFLILAVMGIIESAGIGTMMVVIGLVYWTRVARLVRVETLKLRQLGFIEAATALGYSNRRILLVHILPNALGPILVAATFGVAASIMMEASLSFLGFGTPDATASWGGLLRGAMGNFHAWWLILFPGLAVFATVTSCNVLGEAMRDSFDPHLRHEVE
ncbi:MAG: hypothetical protein A2289_18660 [Deltaproteobacteria bacterium RIFOXYA12_FULL_58_15]|nr:MAG: hypothetical protein A2289_18660 [Deltaproteobacteria bacterium RIFOXYA12_FULL_58_15]OGR12854.1 MAG: hypothetical protein A2341_22015 [Deltaproteobacteria bacterium RIFOXYB12_FULL_58_9]